MEPFSTSVFKVYCSALSCFVTDYAALNRTALFGTAIPSAVRACLVIYYTVMYSQSYTVRYFTALCILYFIAMLGGILCIYVCMVMFVVSGFEWFTAFRSVAAESCLTLLLMDTSEKAKREKERKREREKESGSRASASKSSA